MLLNSYCLFVQKPVCFSKEQVKLEVVYGTQFGNQLKLKPKHEHGPFLDSVKGTGIIESDYGNYIGGKYYRCLITNPADL